MKRDESCLVTNSPSEQKFSESICCQKMVEIHGYNKHFSVTEEDDSPCHATFWLSAANKVKLEQLIKGYIMDHFTSHPDNLLIIKSRIVGDKRSILTQSIKNGEVFQHPNLDTDHEEADIQIIPHAVYVVRQTCMTRIVILSSDTGMFVVAMYFYHLLAANGLAEPMCEVLPTTHAMTCCDSSSKFGTKAAGIKGEPVLYLKDFGRAHTDVQNCVQNAEKFLVQVLNRGKHGIETMDHLRFNWHHHRKSMTTDLPQPVMLQKVIFRGHSMQPTHKSIAWETFH